MRNCVEAYLFDLAAAHDAAKPAKVMRAAELADRILAFLPKTPALCWLIHASGLGLPRLACLHAQALRYLHQPVPDPVAALAHLDDAQAEVDAYLDKTVAWFVERARWIAQLRASIKNPG